MSKLKEQLSCGILSFPGVSQKVFAGKNGELISFLYKDKEFAHFHGDNIIDLRLTKSVIRDEGLNHPLKSKHHPKRSPSSPWIELSFNNKKELESVLGYIEMAIGKIK